MASRRARKDPVKGHRWSGAGYVCADCGAIKDGDGSGDPCSGVSPSFDIWVYYQGAGWWLENDKLSNLTRAMKALDGSLSRGNAIA